MTLTNPLIQNSYVSMGDFKAYFAENGITNLTDDNVIASILNSVSRYFDNATNGRKYIPYIATRNFSRPNSGNGWLNARTLYVDTDLLSVTTLTNGNGTVITTSQYYLSPYNFYPKFAIVLKETAGVVWQYDTSGNKEYVEVVLGVWGMHEDYDHAYTVITTLAGNITAAATSLSVQAGLGASFSNGCVIQIGAEWLAVDDVSTDALTVRRGLNGSTAAIHTSGDNVSLYSPPMDIVGAIKLIGLNVYKRFGSSTGSVTITGAGVVVTPKDVSGIAADTIDQYHSRRIV